MNAGLLRLQLAWRRQHKLAWMFAILLCGNAVLWGYLLPAAKLQRQEAERLLRMEAASAEAAASRERESAPEKRLRKFQGVLGESGASQAQQLLFGIAAKSGLSLEEASYERSAEKNGLFQELRIVIPVKGSYSAVRRFSEQVLLALPYAALDGVAFRRDSVESATVNATLTFVLFLKPDVVLAKRSASASLLPGKGEAL